MTTPIIEQVNHRPYPLPKGRWVMAQEWDDLLFAHWRLPFETLRPLIPERLEIETFAGDAWVSVVPFIMNNVRARWMPPLPWISSFPELNLRTYVTLDGNPGVFFFSLDAGNPLAVAAARRWFHLPYFNANMDGHWVGDRFEYRSIRTHDDASPAYFRASFGPTGPTYLAEPGTLDHWLTERYRLYAHRPDGAILAGEIHHPPWNLQPAAAEIKTNTLNNGLGFDFLADSPLLHFSKHQSVVTWQPRKAGNRE